MQDFCKNPISLFYLTNVLSNILCTGNLDLIQLNLLMTPAYNNVQMCNEDSELNQKSLRYTNFGKMFYLLNFGKSPLPDRAFWGFAEHFKEQADSLLNSLEPTRQKQLQGELSNSSSNNSLNSGGPSRPSRVSSAGSASASAAAAAAKAKNRSRSMSTERSNEIFRLVPCLKLYKTLQNFINCSWNIQYR